LEALRVVGLPSATATGSTTPNDGKGKLQGSRDGSRRSRPNCHKIDGFRKAINVALRFTNMDKSKLDVSSTVEDEFGFAEMAAQDQIRFSQ
jgi:hypothetical protein